MDAIKLYSKILKMLKRLFYFLAVIFMAVTLVACGDKDEDKDDDSSDSESESSESTSNKTPENEYSADIDMPVDYINLVGSSEHPVMLTYLNAKQILDKTGMAADPEKKQMMDGMMMMASQLGLDPASELLVLLEGKDMMTGQALIMGKLKNGETFKRTLQNRFGADFVEKNGVNVAKINTPLPMGNLAVGFNENMFMGVISQQQKAAKDILAIFERAKKAPVSDKYMGFLAQNSDFGYYIAYDGLMNMMSQLMGALPMPEGVDMPNMAKVSKQLANTSSEIHLNFEKGAIVLNMMNNIPAIEDAELVKENGVSDDFKNYLTPDGELFGYIGGAISIEGYMAMLNEYAPINIDSLMKVAGSGFDIKSMLNSFTGEATLALLSVPPMDENEYESTEADLEAKLNKLEGGSGDVDDALDQIKANKENTPDLILTIGVKDFDMVKSILDTAKDIQKKDGMYIMDNDGYMVITESKVVITNVEAVGMEIAENGKLKAYEGVSEYMKKPFAMYFDMAKVQEASKDEKQKQTLAMFKNFEMIGTLSKATMRLNMTNENENALKTILGSVMAEQGM